MYKIERLSREELLRLLRVYAKNWLAHDGCWLMAAEERYGPGAAIELDVRSWERFAASEARRIMAEFNIRPNGGLDALRRAMRFRLYAAVNLQKFEIPDATTMILRMADCRLQKIRREEGLPEFPCRAVGMAEFGAFARTVDERIRTRCISCPPDPPGGASCVWEFTTGQGSGLSLSHTKETPDDKQYSH